LQSDNTHIISQEHQLVRVITMASDTAAVSCIKIICLTPILFLSTFFIFGMWIDVKGHASEMSAATCLITGDGCERVRGWGNHYYDYTVKCDVEVTYGSSTFSATAWKWPTANVRVGSWAYKAKAGDFRDSMAVGDTVQCWYKEADCGLATSKCRSVAFTNHTNNVSKSNAISAIVCSSIVFAMLCLLCCCAVRHGDMKEKPTGGLHKQAMFKYSQRAQSTRMKFKIQKPDGTTEEIIATRHRDGKVEMSKDTSAGEKAPAIE